MIYIKQKIVQRKWLNYITLHIDVDQTKGNVLYHMCLHLQIEGLWKTSFKSSIRWTFLYTFLRLKIWIMNKVKRMVMMDKIIKFSSSMKWILNENERNLVHWMDNVYSINYFHSWSTKGIYDVLISCHITHVNLDTHAPCHPI
jgi:hypothetical protein